jgi:hypothetical protein
VKGGHVIGTAAGLLVAVAFVSPGCSQQGPQPAAVATAPRPPDLFGWVDHMQPTPSIKGPATVPNSVGPARVQVAGRIVDIPEGLPLQGQSACGQLASAQNHLAIHPCWAQIGLEPDGHTASWVDTFAVTERPNPDGTTSTTVGTTGTLARLTDNRIVMTDRTTIPYDARTVFSCAGPTQTTIAGWSGSPFSVDVDPGNGIAERAGCDGPGRM